jgi:fatty acid CoA ligase FadD9
MIRLALTGRLTRFADVSTVAAAFAPGGLALDEDTDVRQATPIRRLRDDVYADGYAHSKWAGEVLLREAHDLFGLPVTVFRSDMIMAHSRYAGQVNVPDIFSRWLFSIVASGLAPRSFYAAGAVTAHYDGLPVDFTAEVISTLGASAGNGFRTFHVVNPHEDGISMDTFVDWVTEAGHPITRIDDYDDFLVRFEVALRSLPEEHRQRSMLPLLHQLRRPATAVAGALVPAQRFGAAVRDNEIGGGGGIPHLSAEYIRKYLDDLRVVGLI